MGHPPYNLTMSNYAIMRMEKLKSRVSLVGSLRHNTRELVPKNADPTLSKHNNIIHTKAESLELYTKLLPKKVRKNAVHAVEVVCTASSEWFEKASKEDRRDFFTDSEEWARKVFGRKNVISVTVHRDEKTPHVHIIALPIVDGKLNAKKLIGGTKYRMRDLQNDFYLKVGKPLGMDRGVERDRPVRHTQPKEFARVMAEKEKELALREDAIRKAEKLNNGTLAGLVAQCTKGLNKAEETECWKAMMAKGEELRALKFEKQVPQENTKGRKK